MPNVLSLNTEKRSHVSSNALHDVGYFRTSINYTIILAIYK